MFHNLAESLAALTMTTLGINVNGLVREADEGTAAHLFQLFMAASFIMSVAFVIRWLVRDPRETLRRGPFSHVRRRKWVETSRRKFENGGALGPIEIW